MTSRARAWALDRGGLVALVMLVAYIALAPRHVVDGDNSEFATLSVTGGAAHPTGYPIYILFLRAMSWLPGASPAHTAAIATAILGAATILVLHAACRAWGASPLAATIACALFGTGPVVLRVVTEAEVFALNNLVVATVLWLSGRNGPLRGAPRALALGLVAGLGLADHVTCVLVAPVGLLGVVRASSEQTRRWRHAATIAAALGGLAIGLSAYGYLLVAPDSPMSWGVVRDFDRVVDFFTRSDYGGPTAFQSSDVAPMPMKNLAAFVATLGRGTWYLAGLAGLAWLVVRSVRRDASESRAAWCMLAVAFVLAGPLLVMRFNVLPEGLGLYVNQRFHLLPLLLLTVPIACAVDAGLHRVSLPRPTLLHGLVASVGAVALIAPSLPYLGRVHSPAVEAGARNMLSSLPPDAVVIHTQDELHAVPAYLQTAVGVRPDVVVVAWSLMIFDWYRQRVAARGIKAAPGPGTPKVQLVATLLARGRPVFVDRLQRDVIAAFPSFPYGVLLRVLPTSARIPDAKEVFELNEQLYASFALDYARPGPHDEFATEVHRRYQSVWTIIAKALERAGDSERSARAAEYARTFGPTDE